MAAKAPQSLQPHAPLAPDTTDNNDDRLLPHVSMKPNDDTHFATASNRLRRRVKWPSPTNTEATPPTLSSPELANVANMQSLIAKDVQRERLTRALSVQKQQQQQHQHAAGDYQRMKRIVFNGTYPIDDPYSSRFDSYAEEREYAYDYDEDEDEEAGDDYDEYEDEEEITDQDYLLNAIT